MTVVEMAIRAERIAGHLARTRQASSIIGARGIWRLRAGEEGQRLQEILGVELDDRDLAAKLIAAMLDHYREVKG